MLTPKILVFSYEKASTQPHTKTSKKSKRKLKLGKNEGKSRLIYSIANFLFVFYFSISHKA